MALKAKAIPRTLFGIVSLCTLFVLVPNIGITANTTAPSWTPLVQRLAADGFPQTELKSIFYDSHLTYDPDAMGSKMRTLYIRKYGSRLVRTIQVKLKALGYYTKTVDGFYGRNTKSAIMGYQKAAGLPQSGKADKALLSALQTHPIKRPAGMPLPILPKAANVYEIILTPTRLAEARAFYKANLPLLSRMRSVYGVPEHVTVGLMTVETRVGKFLGDQLALQNLASMALAENYALVAPLLAEERPNASQTAWARKVSQQKAKWAYKELKALLHYAEHNKVDPLSIPGSVYGAIGICQFMPSNVPKFGIDADGDGCTNLFTLEDAVFSIGNYLKKHGWKDNMTDAQQRKTLYRYNHSNTYVNTILAVAEHVKKTP
ncbi:lytic murein transglycosylase [Desulfovibrio inopinatus]|uniref:lytic murein transglycosylase n=1 Tax=Desulfovibrio inopinatus TaxID=102109 RepID=UPI000426507D|nr:lytic murein transglycosylase [Desulfovibrio inopinatus]